MKIFGERKFLIGTAALLLVLAGCKGESPTAPGSPSGNGTPPPASPTIVVSVSNANPVVNSTSVVTATVNQGGAAVANGTAVQFTTNIGTFTDANSQTTIKTTTNGVATTTLTSTSAGTATVTATVGAVSKSTTVTFSTEPQTPPPPDTAPNISGMSPSTGRPQGGETLTISGKNFRTPIRVFFDFGSGQPVEATVISSTGSQIQVLTPATDLGTGQTKDATVIVITEAGTSTEQRLTAGTFTYQAEILTPKVTTLSPSSGPIDGGTRVTIFGEGFQSPVQVQFGNIGTNTWQDVQVLNVTFSQITIITPVASSTTSAGSGTVTGPVDLQIKNINSATTVQVGNAFRYVAAVQITSVGPTEGTYLGGTKVSIDGQGFNDPVAVVIGGVAAQPISVSPTKIVAITGVANVTSCSDVSGPVSVTNVDNGDSAVATVQFTFRVPTPVVVSSTNATAGGSITVTVLNANGVPRLTLGDTALNITSQSTNSTTGVTTFTATVPSSITLDKETCPAGGSAPIPTAFDVTYTSLTTNCTNTFPKGTTISPTSTPVLFVNPAVFSTFTAKGTANPTPPPTFISVTPSAAQTVSIVNNGAGLLTVQESTTCAEPKWHVSLPNGGSSVGLNECDNAAIVVSYGDPAQVEPSTGDQCTITITSNGGTKTLSLVGNTQ